jgi:hypothetical protein
MSYSNFTIDSLKQRFNLVIRETENLFADVEPVAVGPILSETLKENIPLALSISTEKARSEMIIAPALIEVRRLLGHEVSLFSGIDFTVDREQDLHGVCDYLISLSPEQLSLTAPVVALVEAKNENMKAGIAQCIAEMLAARLFNERRNNPIPFIAGVVTTGSAWKFLLLEGTTVTIDLTEYYIKEVEKIIGILLTLIRRARQPGNDE